MLLKVFKEASLHMLLLLAINTVIMPSLDFTNHARPRDEVPVARSSESSDIDSVGIQARRNTRIREGGR
jgi:hypothetical protein